MRGRDACMRIMRIMRFMRGEWGVTIYPLGLPTAVWYGSGENVPVGYACLFDGNGGMLVAWA